MNVLLPSHFHSRSAPIRTVRRCIASHRLLAQFLIVMSCAFALRAWQFGNPAIQIDEQFYLLVGDRILRGAVPFVDIWDRKPVGTFLLYAAMRLIGGEGIVQYQVVATLFAGTTAFLISVMARRFANGRGATLAGCAYLAWLLVFDGSGGQTPVFYNAFMAGAALLTLHTIELDLSRRRMSALGALAMLLAGIALQIKYSAVFETMFFGCTLLWHWHRDRKHIHTIPVVALLWTGCALLPTISAWGWFAAHGYNHAFVYANFLSIFDRSGWPAAILIERLSKIIGLACPLLICAWLESITQRWHEATRETLARRFAIGWLAAAMSGLLVFGTFFWHYFLPVLVPLCLVSAKLLGDRRAGVTVVVGGRHRMMSFAAFVGLTAGVGIALSVPKQLQSRGRREDIRALARAINRYRSGCMLVFDGEPILYHLTSACLVTTRVFPNHLNDATEATATGIDIGMELRRILAVERPDIIVTSDRPDPHYNDATLRQLRLALNRSYRLVYHRKIGSRERLVYKLVPG